MPSNSRLANDAWEALLTAHAVLIKKLEADDIWQGISIREYDVLYTLSKCPAPIRPSELHRNVLLSQPALSRMVDRLVARGLVQRAKDSHDRRSVRLSLTERGAERQRAIGGRHGVSVARAMTSALDEDELRQLKSICRKLAQGETLITNHRRRTVPDDQPE
ncbi:MAG: MarR family transcriptional regulator [Microlunatus sp.]|nr:MarR family transcriptional regulator [Microlunatus sp.]